MADSRKKFNLRKRNFKFINRTFLKLICLSIFYADWLYVVILNQTKFKLDVSWQIKSSYTCSSYITLFCIDHALLIINRCLATCINSLETWKTEREIKKNMNIFIHLLGKYSVYYILAINAQVAFNCFFLPIFPSVYAFSWKASKFVFRSVLNHYIHFRGFAWQEQ